MKTFLFIKSNLLLILLSFGLSNCGSTQTKTIKYQLTEEPPFTIESVYSQDWVAGIQGGGSGVTLYITFSSVSEDILFNEIYFRENSIQATKIATNKIVGYFKNTLNSDVIMDSDAIKEAANTPPKKIPFQLQKNEAIISFSEKGKLHYYKIVSIVEKEMQAYPKSNPNIKN